MHKIMFSMKNLQTILLPVDYIECKTPRQTEPAEIFSILTTARSMLPELTDLPVILPCLYRSVVMVYICIENVVKGLYAYN